MTLSDTQIAQPAQLDHVALVVTERRPCAERLAELGAQPEPIEEFPGEGTREQYFNLPGGDARLLVMQPIGLGPYQRALAERGPGLHHVALAVAEPAAWVQDLRGWLLHPQTLSTQHHGTWWLARPGLATLVEVTAAREALGEPGLQLGVGGSAAVERRAAWLGSLTCAGLCAAEEGAWLELGGKRVSIAELVAE